MNKWLLSVFAVALTVLSLSLLPKKLMAEGRNFNHVVPFSTQAGRVGFFDQDTGKVYIYDNNLTNCVFVGQMNELGGIITQASSGSVAATTIPTDKNY